MKQRLKELLFFLDKNATSLSKELNVSKTAILRILSGENNPSSKVLIPLGEKLNVNINWLLFGIGEMFMNTPTQDNKKTIESPQADTKDFQKEIKQLKQQLKDKDSLIEEKDKLIQAKDEIIELLKNK